MDLAPVLLVSFFVFLMLVYMFGLWFIHPALSLAVFVGVMLFLFKDQITWKRRK